MFSLLLKDLISDFYPIYQLAKPTFRFRYAHTPFKEKSEGPMDTVASKASNAIFAEQMTSSFSKEIWNSPVLDLKETPFFFFFFFFDMSTSESLHSTQPQGCFNWEKIQWLKHSFSMHNL